MKLQEKNEVITLLKGATFLASGGGGPFELARMIADKYLKNTFEIEIVDPDTLEKNDWLVVAAGMADPNSGTELSSKDIVKPTVNAVHAMHEWLNTNKSTPDFEHFGSFSQFNSLLPIEVGAINVVIPVITAIKKGVRVVDGDPSGRSVPTIDLTTISVTRPVMPNMATTKEKKYRYAVLNVADYGDLQKAYSTLIGAGLLGTDTGLALAPMNGDDLKNSVVKGTLHDAYRIGEIIEKQCSSEKKVDKIIDYLSKYSQTPRDARLICSGRVKEIYTQSVDNTDLGHMTVETDDNRVFTVVIQNENIIGQFEDETCCCITGPDSICYLSKDTDDIYDNVLIAQKLAKNEEVNIHIVAVEASPTVLNDKTLMSNWAKAYRTSGYYGGYTKRLWRKNEMQDKPAY